MYEFEKCIDTDLFYLNLFPSLYIYFFFTGGHDRYCKIRKGKGTEQCRIET